ncbi:MAG: autotransporter outer membrane beta-barrel domain-containing protein, partial [Mailhella sp.]|nr:autotransporter outer membrane beta-barrel domain-containing protein [Mailhella sp.]
MNLTLSGENSSWEGASTVTGQWSEAAHAPSSTQLDVKNLSVSLADGARWIPTVYEAFSITDDDLAQENGTLDGRIAVNNVTLDEGVIVLKSGVEADVENLSGKGDVRVEADGESMGTLTAANAANATLDVQAADADGNALNADQTDVETLKKVKAQVKAEGAAVTASAAEGDVNGAISIDAKGNVSTAKNTLMDAALKQASITTVALDKILTNDVRKRLGDIRSDKNQTGVWMRWDGGKLKGDGLTNNFNTIQIGGDTKVGTNCRIGVAGSFTHGDTDFARGNGELEGFSFALYSTWMGENGMFADIVTRLGHFSNEMNVEGRKGDMDNRVFSLSGEYGWRFDLCKQFFLEPQVELAYTYVSSDDLQLGTARYAFDNVNSLVGRAGLVAGWNLPDDMGSVYARASVLQQFMGDAKISGSNGNAYNVQEIDGNDTWMEYGIGANVKLTDKTYIWADVERTAGADLDEEWRGTVG